MSMTPRFKMPLLFAGQAAKEETHNEALMLCDALIAAHAADRLAVPPSAPDAGACWIVAPQASGDWEGFDNALAFWTVGGWRFVAPVAGQACAVGAAHALWRFDGSGWQAPPMVPTIGVGTVVDQEARAALTAIMAALSAAGLMRST